MPVVKSKAGIKVEEFREYLFGLPSNLRKSSDWSEGFLLNKIRDAEDEIERQLNCFYTKKRIVCEPGDGLIEGQDYDIVEPAYDYDSDFFVGERWGEIRLRHYPVRLKPKPVIKFAYPNKDNTVFNVPPEWVRLNGPFGRIRLVPDKMAVVASMTAFILSVFSGGRGIPQSIFVDYTAGFGDDTDDLVHHHADLLELTKRRAVINLLDDAFIPSSVTNSTDGISQSFSAEVKDYRDQYDKRFERFRNKVKGIRLAVV